MYKNSLLNKSMVIVGIAMLFSCKENFKEAKSVPFIHELTINCDSISKSSSGIIVEDSIFKIYDRGNGLFATASVEKDSLNLTVQRVQADLLYFNKLSGKSIFIDQNTISIKSKDAVTSYKLPAIDSSRYEMAAFANHYSRPASILNDSLLILYVFYRPKGAFLSKQWIQSLSESDRIIYFNLKKRTFEKIEELSRTNYNPLLEHAILSANDEAIYLTYPDVEWIRMYSFNKAETDEHTIDSPNIKVSETETSKIRESDYRLEYYQSNAMVRKLLPDPEGKYLLRFVKRKQESRDQNGLVQPTYLADHVCEYIDLAKKKVIREWLFDGEEFDINPSFIYNGKLYLKNREKSHGSYLSFSGFNIQRM